PITLSNEWFSSTRTNTWLTTGIFPVPPELLPPPQLASTALRKISGKNLHKFLFAAQPLVMERLEECSYPQVALWRPRIAQHVLLRRDLPENHYSLHPIFVLS